MNDQRSNPGETWYDRTIVDTEGAKIGRIADVYLDHDSQRPYWALVHTGLFGTRETIVPIARVSWSGDDVVVPYEKSFVKDAPNVGSDEELSEEDEARLAEYYGLQYSRRSPNGSPADRSDRGDDNNAMTRSEEELQVDTVRRPSELVRLKKRVVTEHQQVTVPVPARGGGDRAGADHGGEPRRGDVRRRDHRGRARGHPPRGGSRRREESGAEGARAPRDGHLDE